MSEKRKGRKTSDAERRLWTKTMTAVQPVRRPQNLAQNSVQEFESYDHSRVTAHHPSQDQTASDWLDYVDTRSLPAPSTRRVKRNVQSASAAMQDHGSKNQSSLPDIEVGKTLGTDRRTADRLRRGRLAIDMRLDLHGLTLDVAHRRLLGFLNAAQTSGARCVLVITGKGSRSNATGQRTDGADGFGEKGIGRLKAAVPRWLNEPAFRPMILSVTDAQPKDGGQGALYILLKKPNRGRL